MIKRIIELFSEISSIPRCSGNESGIRNYIRQWACRNNLNFLTDNAGNCLVTSKDNSIDENIVILQSHMDMVCEKSISSAHDFSKDPLQLIVEGDFISAKDTSLGADNGIGMAISMAFMENNKIYPNIRLLFTSDEEIGMNGAKGIDAFFIKGRYLLNLDSEEDDTIIIGCAGGTDLIISKDMGLVELKEDHKYYRIEVDGFTGGHSGIDIDKNTGNAIKALGRVLKMADVHYLSDIKGGKAHNAIPRYAYADIAFKDDIALIKHIGEDILKEYTKDNPSLKITEITSPPRLMPATEIINIINNIHHGVYKYFTEGLNGVESSSNLAKVEITGNSTFVLVESLRGSSKKSIEEIKSYLEKDLNNFNFYYTCEYPAWQPDFNSRLLFIAKNKYEELFQKKPKVTVIHAGLECGILFEKNSSLDIISIGPNIYSPHSPEEKVSISSIEKCCKFLEAIITTV